WVFRRADQVFRRDRVGKVKYSKESDNPTNLQVDWQGSHT
nr:hypothetical protein [Tanacetum cinerariifolium]